MKPALTVLTTPVPALSEHIYRGVRRLLRRVVKPGVPLPMTPPYPGHAALVRSVVEGLRRIGADFNFNPRKLGELARVVYAPANEALRQAAQLKRARRIDRLVAGPVNALFPDECDGVLRLPEIDRILVASEWVRGLLAAETPELTPKVRVCTSGVDPDFWKPRPEREPTGSAILYWKNAPEPVKDEAETILGRCGLRPVVLHYGNYTVETYRDLLDEADVSVFLSTFETQGLALLEAWSMDVPTLVWNPRGDAEWKGRRFRAGSSCPYLTPATGLAFSRTEEMEVTLRTLLEKRSRFSPRDWLLTHATDAICAEALYGILFERPPSRSHSGTRNSP